MRNCFAYVVKSRVGCVCIFSTTIAGVSFIIEFYVVSCISDIFFANSCLVLIKIVMLTKSH